jgi:hypothetical protein
MLYVKITEEEALKIGSRNYGLTSERNKETKEKKTILNKKRSKRNKPLLTVKMPSVKPLWHKNNSLSKPLKILE